MCLLKWKCFHERDNFPSSSNLHNGMSLALSHTGTHDYKALWILRSCFHFDLLTWKHFLLSDWLAEPSVQGLPVSDSQPWILNMISSCTRPVVKLQLAINIVTRLLYDATQKGKLDVCVCVVTTKKNTWSESVYLILPASTVYDSYT